MFEKLIYVSKNSLSESFCNEVIEKFDRDPRKRDGIVNQNNPTVKKEVKDTKDLTISGLLDWVDEDKVFFDALKIGLENYTSHLKSIHIKCCPKSDYKIEDGGYKIKIGNI